MRMDIKLIYFARNNGAAGNDKFEGTEASWDLVVNGR